MCCFSRPVKHVSQTHIYARSLPGGHQVLVYSMNVGISEELAMILPLPVKKGSPEDAVQFIDLSGYPDFFKDLSAQFPVFMTQAKRGGLMRNAPLPKPKLKVHAVGDFEASYVPTQRDFDRLDERFRLPSHTFDALPQYADYGFAVFKLAPRKKSWLRFFQFNDKRLTIHPMAFRFPTANTEELFFPTVHVHDGELHPEAHFDHSLYGQWPENRGARLGFGWDRSFQPLGQGMPHAPDFIDPADYAYRLTMLGTQKNTDTWIRPGAADAG